MNIVIFCCTFCCTKCLYILLEVLLLFPNSFLCKQTRFELFSPEIVSALEKKYLLSLFRVCRKSATTST